MRSIASLFALLLTGAVQSVTAAVFDRAPAVPKAQGFYAFYVAHMEDTLSQIEKGEHRLPVIREQATYLFSEIEKRHGARPAIHAIPDLHPRDPMIASGSLFDKNGKPAIVLAVPVFYALHGQNRNRGEQAFANSLVVAVLNESRFMATGQATTLDGSIQARIIRYMAVWSETCEQVVLPLLAAKEPILEDENEHCKAWVVGGRTMLSMLWRNFIIARYGLR